MATAFDSRRLVGVHAERVSSVSASDFPGHYPGEDHSWNHDKFSQNLQVEVKRLSQRSVEFDIVGVDASIANALRRIMIAEVPTVAIENVYVWNNTTVIQDEVLAHRLGLIPLNVDPVELEMRAPDAAPSDKDTLTFNMTLKCSRKPSPPPDSTNPDDLYINHELLSSHLVFTPVGAQVAVFAEKLPAATNPNIVLAKLRPGQEVDMILHAVKGVGKDHAKFSPVATASYRLLPNIIIKKEIPPQHAIKFQKCFAPGVIKVDPRTKAVTVEHKNLRKDTVTREVLRHPEFEGSVELSRVRDYFLFTVESESAYPPERILPEAIKVMKEKIVAIRKAVLALKGEAGDVEMSGP